MPASRTRHKITFPGVVPGVGGSIYGNGRNGNQTPRPDYIVDENGCWVWQKHCLNGYPMAAPHGRAHRVYYQLKHGPIPKGTHVHHLCRNTTCVNPDHLEAKTPRSHFEEHFLNERGGITLEDVREIRRLGRLPGQSSTQIAKQFGIRRWTVHQYWLGNRWAEELGEDGPVVPPLPVCQECGRTFESKRRLAKFCGPRCRSNNSAKARRARARAAA